MTDWLATVAEWTEHLRAQGWRLGVGDELNLHALAQQLRERGTPVTSADEAARWFGPLLCGTADEQRRLAPLLQTWHDLQPTPPAALGPELERVATAVLPPARVSRRVLWPAALLALALLLTALWLWDRSARDEIATPVTTPSVPPETRRDNEPLARAIETGFGVLLWGLPAMTALWVRRLRVRRDRALMRGMVARDAPREALRLALPRFDVFAHGALRATVADLRRHRLVDADWIDGSRSARATVRDAGRVHLVLGKRRALPDYLVLVDLKRNDDILSALAELLILLLEQGDVRVDRYDFHGDPSHLQRIGSPQRHSPWLESTELASLRARCPEHRLLIISDATSFCDEHGRQMRTWVDELRQWSEVALLTPLPAEQWGPRERSLARSGFFLTEANDAGLKRLGQALRADRAAGVPLADAATASAAGAHAHPLDRRLARDPYRWLSDTPPDADDVAALLAELRDALGPRAYLYLQALAVFPTLQPRLTLALGHVLPDAQGKRLLNEATLARLCRVPWLRQARLPDWLRRALVRDLDRRTDPQAESGSDEQRVRAAWAQLLSPEADLPSVTPGSAGELSLEVVRAVDPRLPALIARLLASGDASARPALREALLVAFLRGEQIPELAVALPGTKPATAPRRESRVDTLLAAAMLVLGVLGALGAPWVWEQNRAHPDWTLHLVPACWVGFGCAGLIGLLSWYRRELARYWTGRWAWLAPPPDAAAAWRLLPELCAVATLALSLAAVQLEGLREHSLGRLALAVWFNLWCFLGPGRRVLAWAPVLLATQLGWAPADPQWVPSGFGGQPFALVLMAWIATRPGQHWQDLRALLALCLPLWLPGWLLANEVWIGGSIASFVLVAVLARLLSEPGELQRWLRPQRLDGPSAALALGLGLWAPSLTLPDLGLRIDLALSGLLPAASFLAGLCVRPTLLWLAVITTGWGATFLLRLNLGLPDNLVGIGALGDLGTPLAAWMLGQFLRQAVQTNKKTDVWMFILIAAATCVSPKVASFDNRTILESAAVWLSILPFVLLVSAYEATPGRYWALLPTCLVIVLVPFGARWLDPLTPNGEASWVKPDAWRAVGVAAGVAWVLLFGLRLEALRATLRQALEAVAQDGHPTFEWGFTRPDPAQARPRLRLLDWPGRWLAGWLTLTVAVAGARLLLPRALGEFQDGLGKTAVSDLTRPPSSQAAKASEPLPSPAASSPAAQPRSEAPGKQSAR